MFERAAGQHWNASKAEGQWAWEPVSATESRIRWGHPDTWGTEQHPYKEHFRRDGDWVMLDGWEGNGTYYELNVAVQWLAGLDLVTNRVALPPGAQHYAKWTVPALGQGYSLFALGTIIEQSSGKRVAFAHEQRWCNVGPTTNPHLGSAPALRQTEKWWDDNGERPFGMRLHRDVYLAKGHGMAYRIQNRDALSGAATNRIDLRYAWTY
ncbi:hypothetical protein [Prauserella cavernicola]|uniref:Uncharacterized protein n=1 Tax=Prauserella cavernicola TaxID=2800127 RepID=A0A934V8L1_9PSEU|nr:hypothetical protein [Prauserella cavernicola]MBK1788799.1 hypothetical protein [Prauserella cavernicola]